MSPGQPWSARHYTGVTMRHDPLHYLDDELNALRNQGLYRRLRVLDERAEGDTPRRSSLGRQPLVEQLPRAHDAPAAARARHRGDPALRCRLGLGPHHRRHDGHPHGARAEARRVQADRGSSRLSERLHRQRRHRVVDPRHGRLHRLRRAESRQHHRRRAPEPRHDQGVSPSRRERCPEDRRSAAARPADADHHRRRVQHGRRPRAASRRCAISRTSSAAS